jgi:hypothetical protein
MALVAGVSRALEAVAASASVAPAFTVGATTIEQCAETLVVT